MKMAKHSLWSRKGGEPTHGNLLEYILKWQEILETRLDFVYVK